MNPLLVPELLCCVLDCFTTPTYTGIPATMGWEERKTLAALARTCRTFSEPSLDCLWRRLDSLMPLIRTFADVVDDARAKVRPRLRACPGSLDVQHVHIIFNKNPPSSVERRIIDRYAHRIQELTLATDRLSLDFLQSANLVLPNLKVLRWVRPCGALQRRPITVDISCPIRRFRGLLNPNTDTLEVTMASANSGALQSFMQDYPSLCPNLKSIKFDVWSARRRGPVLTTGFFSEFLCIRSDWKKVDISFYIDATAFKHIGASSSLEAVSVALAPEVTQPCFEQTETPFRNVTRLALTVWNRLEVAANVLRDDQTFVDFKVLLRNHQSSLAELSALSSALASPPRMHSLRSVVIAQKTEGASMPPPSERRGLSYETLWPLTSLGRLHELVLNVNHTLAIGDDEFERLVCHWPHLRVFELMGWCGTESLSLKALTTLIKCCPDVYSIGVTLDARQVPSSTDADVQSKLVTRLEVQDCPIKNAKLVESFLLKHVPSVRAVLQKDMSAMRIGNDIVNKRILSWGYVTRFIRDRR